uniref:hypothetical protein n=1 Tax=Marinobacterium profundum TaxID=1714300 RepID=UPI001C1F34CC
NWRSSWNTSGQQFHGVFVVDHLSGELIAEFAALVFELAFVVDLLRATVSWRLCCRSSVG